LDVVDNYNSTGRGDGTGKGVMTQHGSFTEDARGITMDDTAVPLQLSSTGGDGGFVDADYTTGLFTRPRPPPPLITPALRSPGFPFENRRPSIAASIPPELEKSFINQPNPDYMGSSTSADIRTSPSPQSTIPRRRSYSKTAPIGIPIPKATSASSSAETMSSIDTFSPSSYPPTSPLLPPPPPGGDVPLGYVFVGGPGRHGIGEEEHDHPEEIDVHGEIVSVMDDDGQGWKRHTRVYGGGVCLACLASKGGGGFYGDTVPLADRRY